MGRPRWMPCCKPCLVCPVCIPGTYSNTYAAVIRFKGTSQDDQCDCSTELIGPTFEIPRTGLVEYPDGITCCEYEGPMTACSGDSYFNNLKFGWCAINGLDAIAFLELDYVCDVITVPPGATGQWRFECAFQWDSQDQDKGRYCNEPVRVDYAAIGDTGCFNYSLCWLYNVYAEVTFIPPGPGPPDVVETKCPVI